MGWAQRRRRASECQSRLAQESSGLWVSLCEWHRETQKNTHRHRHTHTRKHNTHTARNQKHLQRQAKLARRPGEKQPNLASWALTSFDTPSLEIRPAHVRLKSNEMERKLAWQSRRKSRTAREPQATAKRRPESDGERTKQNECNKKTRTHSPDMR